MTIIGRKEEQLELEKCEKSRKSELICVYGRRRVGKTFLIEQTFANYFAFRATGVESGNTRTQLKSFHQRLLDAGDNSKSIPKNWFEAFSRLEKILESDNVRLSVYGKKIVFFDEFPWFATARSDFLEAFGEFWNRCGTVRRNYMFIICGSATSWIIKNILENTGSLYNRVTSQIFLHPFSLRETEKYMLDRGFGWSRRQIAECQMIFGGLPYFFDLINPNESLSWNIDSLILQPHALLRHESKKLLESTLKKSTSYDEIMKCLASHYYGLEKLECYKQLNISEGTFYRSVENLVKCGYIHESVDYHTKNHPLRLQLVDPFLLFHYKFLQESAGQTMHFSDLYSDSGRYMNWRGHAFEILCMYHINSVKKALGISGVKTSEYSWISNQGKAQIDLVIDRDDGIINICEEKYTDTPFTISKDYATNLINKINIYREETNTKKAIKLVIISAENISGVANTDNITRVITLDDLFE